MGIKSEAIHNLQAGITYNLRYTYQGMSNTFGGVHPPVFTDCEVSVRRLVIYVATGISDRGIACIWQPVGRRTDLCAISLLNAKTSEHMRITELSTASNSTYPFKIVNNRKSGSWQPGAYLFTARTWGAQAEENSPLSYSANEHGMGL